MPTTRSSNIIEMFFNRNFGNNYNHHNGPNQNHNIHKYTVQSINQEPYRDKITYHLQAVFVC